ncbi:hypothetical protein [Actinomadura livida]|uniref:Endonuclease/exonuclease/phosphatase (EEP) superfamily protein YafD n=1 Tax=Actinomadura livida TaxID=79909 RepID=A0A7W7IBF9_9ACTN|nr:MULTISPECIES: hypothetical protein [Actinomadura]MBB4774026.1 endonuclease/exonuclease/phosphatase (EEP) superfamily protein YafD [Actinomadura catellatispora]GGT85382.1 hypothetical protein GCM10010208_05330 [Actinomadura livida]
MRTAVHPMVWVALLEAAWWAALVALLPLVVWCRAGRASLVVTALVRFAVLAVSLPLMAGRWCSGRAGLPLVRAVESPMVVGLPEVAWWAAVVSLL